MNEDSGKERARRTGRDGCGKEGRQESRGVTGEEDRTTGWVTKARQSRGGTWQGGTQQGLDETSPEGREESEGPCPDGCPSGDSWAPAGAALPGPRVGHLLEITKKLSK